MRKISWILMLSVGMAAVAGCFSESNNDRQSPAFYAAESLDCDQDLASVESNGIIERVGGLVTDHFVVRFAESTRAGVVALVDADPAMAFKELSDKYGVTLVAQDADDADPTTIRGFDQIRDLVEAACAASE